MVRRETNLRDVAGLKRITFGKLMHSVVYSKYCSDQKHNVFRTIHFKLLKDCEFFFDIRRFFMVIMFYTIRFLFKSTKTTRLMYASCHTHIALLDGCKTNRALHNIPSLHEMKIVKFIVIDL